MIDCGVKMRRMKKTKKVPQWRDYKRCSLSLNQCLRSARSPKRATQPSFIAKNSLNVDIVVGSNSGRYGFLYD